MHNEVGGTTSLSPGDTLAPTPDGAPLTFKIRCWTSQGPRPATVTHAITLHPDWSVEVPHDLESERLAQAFGGWLSCLELESHTIRAAQHWLGLMLRAVPPPLRQALSGSWIAYPAQSCCRSGGYDNPGTAFDHARDLNHLIKLKRAPYKQLRDVVRAISAARNVDQTPPIPHDLGEAAAACLTLGRADVGRLWQAGVHPRYVLETREALGLTGRMPASFYLAVVTRRPDLEWMRSTLEAAGPLELPTQVSPGGVVLDADGHMSLPEWLAHTQAAWDLADPTERGRWLSLGISRQVLLGLGGRGYSPEDIATLAEGMSRSADGAARYLVSWLVCDVRPRIADLVELHRSGRTSLWHAPTQAGLHRAVEELEELEALPSEQQIDRLTVAFLLAVCGNVPDTVAAYRAGRSWRDEPLTEERTA